MDKFQCKPDHKGRLDLVNITDIEAREILPIFGQGFELGKIYLESDFKIVKVNYRRYIKEKNKLKLNMGPVHTEFRVIHISMLDVYKNSTHKTRYKDVICMVEF